MLSLFAPARQAVAAPWVPRLLHVSGAASFPWRKGTAPLLRAVAALGDHVKLTLVGSPRLTEAARVAGVAHVTHYDRATGFTPMEFHKLLGAHDAVVQPSRGEGFGMVPLEARCAGTPVIMTAGTGHADHRADCDVIIPTGLPEQMETQGNSAGSAPTVASEAIARSLRYFLDTQPERIRQTQEWADTHRYAWAWSRRLASATTYLRSELKGKKRRLWG